MNKIFFGDCIQSLQALPEKIVHTCVTSPPYFGLRDYGHEGQIGLEQTPDEYVAKLVEVFREVRRVLRDDGTLWCNLGDSYNAHPGQRKETDKAGDKQQTVRGATAAPSRSVNGLKPKDLIGIPWRVALALQADGWYLRQDIIWAKPNPMPESVTDRCTKSHEYIFLLAKSGKPTVWRAKDTGEWSSTPDLSERIPNPTEADPEATEARWRGHDYYFDHEAIKEPAQNWGTRDRSNFRGGTEDPLLKQYGLKGKPDEENPTRNRRSVWNVSTKPYKGAHFATFPPDLITPCVLAGSPPEGTVLDPFMGSGTTAMVALTHGRRYIGCELNPAYGPLQEERIYKLFADMI
jgi:DNA modification methylase